jgi:hypothetical protein
MGGDGQERGRAWTGWGAGTRLHSGGPGIGPCATMSHMSSECAGTRSDRVGCVASGECSAPVSALTCVAGNGGVRSTGKKPKRTRSVTPVASRMCGTWKPRQVPGFESGRPTVRQADGLARTGCSRSECRCAERRLAHSYMLIGLRRPGKSRGLRAFIRTGSKRPLRSGIDPSRPENRVASTARFSPRPESACVTGHPATRAGAADRQEIAWPPQHRQSRTRPLRPRKP